MLNIDFFFKNQYICVVNNTSRSDLSVFSATLPATSPDESVAMTGLCLELILLRGLKRSPSRAMANMTRGIRNIEPNKLPQTIVDIISKFPLHFPYMDKLPVMVAMVVSLVPGVPLHLNTIRNKPTKNHLSLFLETYLLYL